MANHKLLNSVSANTVGQWVKGDGGSVTLVIYGANLDGGVITLDFSIDNKVTASPLTYNSSTAIFSTFQSLFITSVPQNAWIRATLAGGGGSISNVTVEITS